MMRQQTKTLYSTYDPRVGMRVSSLMYRWVLSVVVFIVVMHGG